MSSSSAFEAAPAQTSGPSGQASSTDAATRDQLTYRVKLLLQDAMLKDLAQERSTRNAASAQSPSWVSQSLAEEVARFSRLANKVARVSSWFNLTLAAVGLVTAVLFVMTWIIHPDATLGRVDVPQDVARVVKDMPTPPDKVVKTTITVAAPAASPAAPVSADSVDNAVVGATAGSLLDITQGPLGVALAVTTLLVGLAIAFVRQTILPVFAALGMALFICFGPQMVATTLENDEPQTPMIAQDPSQAQAPAKLASAKLAAAKPQTKVVVTHIPATVPSDVFDADVSNLDAVATGKFLQPLVASGKLQAYEVNYLMAQEQMVSGKLSPQFEDLVKSLRAGEGLNPEVSYALDMKARVPLSPAAEHYVSHVTQVRAARAARAHVMLLLLLGVMVGAGVAAGGSRKLTRRQSYLRNSGVLGASA
jgi:hypothetical protein